MNFNDSYILKQSAAVAAGVMAASLSLTVTACGKSTTTVASPIGSGTNAATSPAATPSAAAGVIGADCSLIPAHGNGSLSSMSTQQALAAASTNPQFSVFIAALRTAGLDKTLSTRQGFTLMIPVNSAFASLSKTDIIHLHNSGDLLRIARYHVIAMRVAPAQFDRGVMVPTTEGSTVRLARAGAAYTVNSATVLCGNIKTANATIYILNKVLMPSK